MVQTFHSGPFAHFADIFCEKWLEIEILALDLPKMQQSIKKMFIICQIFRIIFIYIQNDNH